MAKRRFAVHCRDVPWFVQIDLYVPAVGDGWEHNNNILLNGHGEKSIILFQPFVELTEEEMLCIRWHMGV